MANNSNGNSETSSDSLNGSWVNLDHSVRNGSSVHHSPTGSQTGMEDLLAEAVEDHYRQNSNGEKSTPQSPTRLSDLAQESVSVLPQQPKTDWIWEWSSGIERQPPKEWKLRHPKGKKEAKSRTSLSLRKTKVMKSDLMNVNFYIVVPTIVITHLVAFGIGMYVGKKMTMLQSA